MSLLEISISQQIGHRQNKRELIPNLDLEAPGERAQFLNDLSREKASLRGPMPVGKTLHRAQLLCWVLKLRLLTSILFLTPKQMMSIGNEFELNP